MNDSIKKSCVRVAADIDPLAQLRGGRTAKLATEVALGDQQLARTSSIAHRTGPHGG